MQTLVVVVCGNSDGPCNLDYLLRGAQHKRINEWKGGEPLVRELVVSL